MTLVSALIRLFPRQFRDDFAGEMLATYDEAATEHRSLGEFAYRLFTVRELAGLTLGLIREWAARSLAELKSNHERWTRAAHYLTACSLALAIHALFYGNALPIGNTAAAATGARSADVALCSIVFATSIELFSFALANVTRSGDL